MVLAAMILVNPEVVTILDLQHLQVDSVSIPYLVSVKRVESVINTSIQNTQVTVRLSV